MYSSDNDTPSKVYFKKYLYQGLMWFLIIAASVAFFFFLFRIDSIMRFFKKVTDILQPVILGLIIAYIINPLVNRFDKVFLSFFGPRAKNPQKLKGTIRYMSIFISLIFGGLILYILGNMILPEIYVTIAGIVRDLPDNVNRFTTWVETMTASNELFVKYFNQGFIRISQYFENWVQGDLLKQVNTWATFFATSVLNFLNVIKNLLIGIIISVYVLVSKEKFCAQTKMIIYALTKEHTANAVIDTARESHKIFSGFIIGKLIDSTIIGIICFIVLSFMDMPYTMLVSVIVGVTNIIPFFGPFIGAIPSILLILVVSPIQALYFLIFILLLQQFDGNILGPKILGDSTGLSAFWVVFSILFAGGLFGLVGMLFGVPTFAVIYFIVRRIITALLNKKNLKSSSLEYETIKSIQTVDGNTIYIPLNTNIGTSEFLDNTSRAFSDEQTVNNVENEPENKLENGPENKLENGSENKLENKSENKSENKLENEPENELRNGSENDIECENENNIVKKHKK